MVSISHQPWKAWAQPIRDDGNWSPRTSWKAAGSPFLSNNILCLPLPLKFELLRTLRTKTTRNRKHEAETESGENCESSILSNSASSNAKHCLNCLGVKLVNELWQAALSCVGAVCKQSSLVEFPFCPSGQVTIQIQS